MTTQTSLSRILPDYFEVKIGSSIFELEIDTLMSSMTHQYLSRSNASNEFENYDVFYGVTKSEIKSFLFEKIKNDENFIDLFGNWIEDFRSFNEKKNAPLSRDLEFTFSDGSKWSIKILDLMGLRSTPENNFIVNFDDPILQDDSSFLEWVNSLNWDDISHFAEEIKRPQPEPDYKSEWANVNKNIVEWEDNFNIFDFFEIDDTMSEEDSDDDRPLQDH